MAIEDDDNFFSRWSGRKAQVRSGEPLPAEPAPLVPRVAPPATASAPSAAVPAEVVPETGVKARPAPMAGGPFVASSGEMNLTEAEPMAKDESWNESSEKPEA